MKEALTTSHQLIAGDSRKMPGIPDQSIDLVVTSPPYPMIGMWDTLFGNLNTQITSQLIEEAPMAAFRLMHAELGKVWSEVDRVLKPGGIACINIGDATRTVNGHFSLYPNHSSIILAFLDMGFSNLPNIIWKKPTNAPNKFMGSGTLPVGAYVTLEHEFILIFRKGTKRTFDKPEDKLHRKESAFFWEERNLWFADTWDLKGKSQRIEGADRTRSAAYPFELAHRLINMFSLIGDTVLDPFNGTGTTTEAAIANGRHSIGYELDNTLNEKVKYQIQKRIPSFRSLVRKRIAAHRKVVQSGPGDYGHFNAHYDIAVKTRQETDLTLPEPLECRSVDGELHVTYQ